LAGRDLQVGDPPGRVWPVGISNPLRLILKA